MSKDSCAIQRAILNREDQIERKLESMFDQLDKQFLNSDMSESEYKAKCAEIQQWAREQYGIGEY